MRCRHMLPNGARLTGDANFRLVPGTARQPKATSRSRQPRAHERRRTSMRGSTFGVPSCLVVPTHYCDTSERREDELVARARIWFRFAPVRSGIRGGSRSTAPRCRWHWHQSSRDHTVGRRHHRSRWWMMLTMPLSALEDRTDGARMGGGINDPEGRPQY